VDERRYILNTTRCWTGNHVQLTKHWCNMVGSLIAPYQPGGSVLYGLQATEQFVRDAKALQ